MMENINQVFEEYVQSITYIINFIDREIGRNDILLRKNSGLIKESRYNLNDPIIKGYAFHGFGCTFKTRKHNIDVEFTENGLIGFTQWSFYTYCKSILNASESIVCDFIIEREIEGTLQYNDGVYVPTK